MAFNLALLQLFSDQLASLQDIAEDDIQEGTIQGTNRRGSHCLCWK